jgi:hypothetical protein
VVDGGITAARKQLTAAKAQRDRGDRIAADTRLRFNRAADAWLAARVARLRPQTGATYRAHLVHLRDRWGRTRLSAIQPTSPRTSPNSTAAARPAGPSGRGWTSCPACSRTPDATSATPA